MSLAHDGANRQDQPLFEPTLASKCGYTPYIRARGEEIKLKTRIPGWRARRSVVEAPHSCLNETAAS